MAITPARDKGSYRHMLDLVCSPDFTAIMNNLPKGTGAQIATEPCPRPKSRVDEPDWREYVLEDYLKENPLKQLTNGLDRKWWIPHTGNRPNWDLICRISLDGRDGLLLVEAKAHEIELAEQSRKELSQDASPAAVENHQRIQRRIEEANRDLTALGVGKFSLSTQSHYQLANRFKYLNKLASDGVPVVLMYLGWIQSPDWPDDPLQSDDHWRRIVKKHVEAVAPWGFAERSFATASGGSLQLVVRCEKSNRVSANKQS